jgi:hypothetical protein
MMKRFTGLAVAAWVGAGLFAFARTAAAGSRELSYAAEDAAFQAVTQMATDSRVNVKRIAFVKLMKGSADIPEYEEISTVFENGLVQAPSDFQFLTHQDHAGEWTEIDRFFDAATDFGDYDPKTLPKIGVFKMADAFVIGQVLGAESGSNKASVRISLRLIKIDTAERLWAGTVEGIYDDPGPDYQVVDDTARQAIDKAVQAAASDATLSRLAGYQVLVLPFEGPLGRAVTQTFLKKVAENPEVRVLDLPNGSASDRMIARFLRERAGTNRQVSNSLLRRIANDIGGDRDKPGDKLAIMKGGVTTLEVSPATLVDPVGACLGTATGSATPPKLNPVRVKLGFEAKFLDVGDGFATVASVKGFGEQLKNVGVTLVDQILALATLRNVGLIIGAVIVLFLVGMVLKQMVRVR